MRLEKESFQFSSKELIIRVEYKHYLISLLLMLLDLLLLHQVEKSCITGLKREFNNLALIL
jgi:hypothetical protein